MNAQQFATELKATIQKNKENGTEAIYCDNLIAYLDDVAKSPSQTLTEVELAKYKADLQLHIEQNRNYHDSQLEMFRSVITMGQNAIRSSFLLNGGASVVLLAFIGHLAAIKTEHVETFADVLMFFVLGTLAITVTSGVAYLSQSLYASSKPAIQKWGNGFRIACIILVFFSYVFFICGMFQADFAFTNFV